MTIFNKKELKGKFDLVRTVIAKNSPMASLATINVMINGDEYKLIGANGEMQVTASGVCKGSGSFDVCVMPSVFGVMIGSAKDEIKVEIKGDKLSTVSGKSKFNMACTPGDMFPKIKLEGDINKINIVPLIANVFKAAPKIDVRNMLTGVCLQSIGGKLSAVASDGAVLMIDQEDHECEDFQIIIPNESAAYLTNLSIDGFVVSNKSLKAIDSARNIEVITKLIDAKYVQWERIIDDYDASFIVDRKELLDAVTSISKIDAANSVDLESKDGSLIISMTGRDGTSITNELTCTGDNFTASYQPIKLMLCLSSFNDEEIALSFNDQKYLQSREDNKRFFLAALRK